MNTRRPSPFELFDAFTFGAVALIATVLVTYAIIMGTTVEAALLLVTVALAMWAIYAIVVWSKAQVYARYDLVIDGLAIDTNGYITSEQKMRDELDDLCRRCVAAGLDPRTQISKDWIFVDFKPGTVATPWQKTKRLAGFVTCGGSEATVGYFRKVDGTYLADPSVPIEQTAFSHEIAHIIIGRQTGKWNGQEHHEFMAKHGLK